MFNLDSINASIAQMKIFIAVVEANSFTRAARLLNMTQSAVSKNVMALEEYLGFKLFIRDKKRLILTHEGRFLYLKWLVILSDIDKSIDDAKTMRGGKETTISVGMLSTHKPEIYLYPIIDILKEINPEVSVYVEDCPSELLRTNLINGDYDVTFNVLYDIEQLGTKQFHSKVVKNCPLEVGVLKDSPLAGKKELNVEELKNYNFICISARNTPAYYNMLKSLCMMAGFQPTITCYTNSANSQIYNLRDEKDVFIADRFYSLHGDKYFSWIPLKNTSSGVVASWKKDNLKPEMDDFMKAVDRFITEGH